MATTNLLAPQTAAGNTADVVVAAGATVTLALMTAGGGPVPSGAVGTITRKNSSGGYDHAGVVLTAQLPVQTVSGPVTVRVEKGATSAAVGVDQDT